MVHQRIFSLFLILLITQSATEDIRLFRMSKINGWQFQCANNTCLPFTTVTVSSMIKCQTNCLAQIHCRAVTFHKSISTCQLFDDIINQNSNMLANTDTISATVILQTRIPPEPTTTSTTSTSTTSTTTTTTSSTSTSTTTSTTTTTTSTTTSKTTTTTTTTTTTSSLSNAFSLSQTIDGRIITCNSVNNTNLYTECSTLQQGGLYFPNGVACTTWSTTTSGTWDTIGFCRKITGSLLATIYVYYDCDTAQTRVTWIADVWSTNNDNGFTRNLRCYY
ncbi:unnamed protein product [Adineta steineri]|uniref:Apple domain-containing protein n=1 Tax=Adineta steineri TaxID=433720 RepID=A0A815L430_9BILA|nr:unnamed protein product [Adineta steineri]CAF1404212.1 unnamed protein product [Adineta steineri]